MRRLEYRFLSLSYVFVCSQEKKRRIGGWERIGPAQYIFKQQLPLLVCKVVRFLVKLSIEHVKNARKTARNGNKKRKVMNLFHSTQKVSDLKALQWTQNPE